MGTITKKETVTEFKEVTTGYKCDVCRKEIESKHFPDEWYRFSHGHGDWGNDSFESVEYFDVCSPECYLRQLFYSYKEMKSYRSAEIDDKPILFVKSLLDHLNIKE
jgi:hypothetical protein